MALAALTAGSVYAAPLQQLPKIDTAKTKKVKPRSGTGTIRINGDTTEVKVVKDSIKK